MNPASRPIQWFFLFTDFAYVQSGNVHRCSPSRSWRTRRALKICSLISLGRNVSKLFVSGDESAISPSQSAAASTSGLAFCLRSRKDRERCSSGLGVNVGVTGAEFETRCVLWSLLKNGVTGFGGGMTSSTPPSHGVSLHSKSLRAGLLVLFFFPKLSLILDIDLEDMDGKDENECVREGTL